MEKLKRLYRGTQQLKRSKARTAERVAEEKRRIKKAHREYTEEAQRYVEKARAAIELVKKTGAVFSTRTLVRMALELRIMRFSARH